MEEGRKVKSQIFASENLNYFLGQLLKMTNIDLKIK